MLLDEPLEGLAPIIVEELLKALRRIIRDEGMSAILVEQNAKKILGVTDHAIIVDRGCVVHSAYSAKLATIARRSKCISASPILGRAASGGRATKIRR